LERFIEAYTNPGEVVLDIFNGTASTMVACENTGRIFKGCEFDKEYYDLSTARYTTLTGQQYNNNLINQIGNSP
jgi:site-specific DNA-methyltransferase (adenine-specific)